MCSSVLSCAVRLMYIQNQGNPNWIRKAIYEGLYIKICFFGAKRGFESSLMELSEIMANQRGKKEF